MTTRSFDSLASGQRRQERVTDEDVYQCVFTTSLTTTLCLRKDSPVFVATRCASRMSDSLCFDEVILTFGVILSLGIFRTSCNQRHLSGRMELLRRRLSLSAIETIFGYRAWRTHCTPLATCSRTLVGMGTRASSFQRNSSKSSRTS